MIVYQKNKSEFLEDTFKRDIEDVVRTEFLARTGHRVSPAVVRSWKESLAAVAKVLNDAEIPDDSGVAIEYGIQQTGKRIDLMLSGRNATHDDNVIIIELKQWSAAKKTDKDGIVISRYAAGEEEVAHPSYQAWSYASLLEGFNEAVYDGGIRLFPCAYLHNYVSDKILADVFYQYYVEKAPLFLKGEAERRKLQDFIKRHVKSGDNGELIYRIENGRIKPSKGLIDSLSGMLAGNQEFVLIDDQKVVFENALTIARKASEKPKHVFIIEGGPGTGKSVVAINLLVALTASGLLCKYVTKNAAPRAVFQQRLTGHMRRTAISNLFTGSGSFTTTESNDIDVLVVDEAHRLNEKSGLYANLGENQIAELIKSAKCAIFFIDEDQRVTWKDIGRKEEIRHWAKQYGARVTEMGLASQFRCNGSDGYIPWLDNTLQIRQTVNEMLDPAEFDFRVLDSPEDLRKLIFEKNKQHNKARMVAGYCWDWVSKRDPGKPDVVIPEFGFGMRWNLTADGGLWMVADKSVNEIGCIHTCQGLEVDYIGVIVGPDLVIQNGELTTRPEARSKNDRSIHGYKALLKANADAANSQVDTIIRNTYRTLMTRGMKGCYVYFTDKPTAEYFKARLVRASSHALPTGVKGETPSSSDDNFDGNVLPFKRLPAKEVKPYINAVPLIDLKFAAGGFSEFQSIADDEVTWVELPSVFRPERGLFVAQVIGESMNRRIPNGAWCVFRFEPAGTRQGKVVVAQHRRIHDTELGGSYTVKLYYSEKVTTDESWAHSRIELRPDSTDSRFQKIEFTADDAEGVKIIAELLAVL
ncbi:MAG: DNA/RNA helicase domain-containing protein [Betaproteobacteria bacterium]